MDAQGSQTGGHARTPRNNGVPRPARPCAHPPAEACVDIMVRCPFLTLPTRHHDIQPHRSISRSP